MLTWLTSDRGMLVGGDERKEVVDERSEWSRPLPVLIFLENCMHT
jgi:hypothetical protein